MNRENPTISGLYYRYKRLDDKKIVGYLERIKIVKKQNKGVGTIYGYYPLNDSEIEKLKPKPRGKSLTFDAVETSDNVMTNLSEWKTITFLVKSTSRFFLKPDIGEVFDQIFWRDLEMTKIIKAICIEDGYETLPDTDGEHHLMKATLLVNTEDLEEAKRFDRLI